MVLWRCAGASSRTSRSSASVMPETLVQLVCTKSALSPADAVAQYLLQVLRRAGVPGAERVHTADPDEGGPFEHGHLVRRNTEGVGDAIHHVSNDGRPVPAPQSLQHPPP